MTPTCPVCDAEVPSFRHLLYFASTTASATAQDDVHGWFEETARVATFLGALAAAAPRAVAQCSTGGHVPQWADTLGWLAEELSEELGRRLVRLQEAGSHWKRRAEEVQQPVRTTQKGEQ
jgi:hypothetical protein